MKALIILILIYRCTSLTNTELPFRNPELPLNLRLGDLLSRLTIDELIDHVSKGGAGSNHGPAPEIKRLGIRPYQWRTNPGDGETTSFPLPINQAASFDVRSVHRVAFATGLEMRAKWNAYSQEGDYEDGKGIHVFAPVMNLMRHPLWGRNQETYGEDPYLAGSLGRAYVRGVGGWKTVDLEDTRNNNNPLETHVLLVAANCKHFAVHTGPEDFPVSRLSFQANLTEKDLWTTYMYAFRACLKAGAVSVMCAYSGINGTPDCVNHWLLTNILRNQWRFQGFVVTDCAALQFAISKHRAFSNNSDTALAAVRAGVNLENSAEGVDHVFAALPQLVQDGRVTRDQLVQMARPLFLTRFLQGEFNPSEWDPYRFLSPERLIHSASHRRLALIETARTIVLLQHRDGFLPLRSSQLDNTLPLNHALVVGPFATTVDELYGDYRSVRVPEFEVPLSKGISTIAKQIHANDICLDGGRCSVYNVSVLEHMLEYDDLDLVIVTVGTGSKVEGEGLDRHNISLPGNQGTILLHSLDLAAGRGVFRRRHPVPVIVMVFSTGPVEISVALKDENVKAVFWCGFPGPQIGTVMAHMLLGRSDEPFGPSRPLSWIQANELGLSDWTYTIDESYWWTPAARLPFTWYESIDQLANITVYDMTNQTYRYLPPECYLGRDPCAIPLLFPFGYGLTYNMKRPNVSGFVYSNLLKPTGSVEPNQPFAVYATVTNNGRIASEEVVQLYINWVPPNPVKPELNFTHPIIQLAGFERVALAVGEWNQVRFILRPSDQLAVWSERSGRMVPGRGRLRLSIGGQQPEQRTTVGSTVLVGFVTIGS